MSFINIFSVLDGKYEIRKIQFVPERSQEKWATNHEQSPRNKELRPLYVTCGLDNLGGENHDD